MGWLNWVVGGSVVDGLNWVVGGSVVDGMAQLGSWWLSSGWDGSIG
jgi:hypothetical protein